MTNKHTPDPWFAVNYGGFMCIQSGPNYNDPDLLDEDQVGVAAVAANAKLMSNAARMYAALCIVRRSILTEDGIDLVAILDDAISKAEGGA